MAAHPLDDRWIAVAELRRERRRGGEPGRDRLAVRQRAVSRLGLDRVREGVAEVHQRAVATVAFIGGHDPRLRLAAEPHRLDQRAGVEPEQRCDAFSSSQANSASPRIRAHFTTSP